VDRGYVGVGEQIFVIASGSLNAKLVGELSRCLGGASGNADYFYVAEATQCLSVDAAHEADSEDCNLWLFQIKFQSSPNHAK
jgi:hypothetical protein